MTTTDSTEARTSDAPARLGRADFERLLAEHYGSQGWHVERCANTHGIDRGIDYRLRRQNESVLLHCRHWNALQVPMHEVNGLIAAMAAESATGAILICGGEFSPEAKVAAHRQTRLQLIDGAALREMLGPLPEPARNRATFQAAAPPPASRPAASASRVTASTAAASSRAARSSSPMQIGGGLVFLGLLIAAAVFVYGVMNQAPSPPPIVVAPPPVPAPATTAAADTAAEETPPPKPTIEVPGVDDALPNDPAQTPTSAEAEAREAQRRAEEAMKVIESNTPEI